MQSHTIYKVHYYWSALWAAIVTVVCSTGFSVSCLLGRTPERFRRWGKFWARGLFAGTGIRVKAEIPTSLATNGTFVFVANHQNSLDIPVMLQALPSAFGFVAKASLEQVPFLGWAIKLSPSVFVDTQNPRRSHESIVTASKRIANGNSVLVFPEGKRTWSNELAAFKRSAFMLAAEADIPVVPVAILDAHLIFDERRHISKPGTVHVVAGDPIKPHGSDRDAVDELSRKAKNEIISLIRRNTPARVLSTD